MPKATAQQWPGTLNPIPSQGEVRVPGPASPERLPAGYKENGSGSVMFHDPVPRFDANVPREAT